LSAHVVFDEVDCDTASVAGLSDPNRNDADGLGLSSPPPGVLNAIIPMGPGCEFTGGNAEHLWRGVSDLWDLPNSGVVSGPRREILLL
jgi:hypothetical protein